MKINLLTTKLIFSVFPLLFLLNAEAGWTSGEIKSVLITKNNILMFNSGVKNQPPNCQTVPNQWAIDLALASGRAMYALLLSAQAHGKAVTVVGLNSCTVWPDRETVDYLWIN